MMGTRGEARRFAAERLKASGLPGVLLEADLLCMEVFRCSRETLLAHPERFVTRAQENHLDSLVEARILRTPMAYLSGKCSFWGMDLEVGQGCLIPRPETEGLVEAALSHFDGKRFLDWGTGSGCVALAILSERPGASALMMEENPASLSWAWKNLKRSGFLDRALLWHGACLEKVPTSWLPLDLIVGNPPYIPSEEINGLMPDVRLYEPVQALDGGKDGLDDVRDILAGAERMLSPSGWVVLEVGGSRQAEFLMELPVPGLEFFGTVKDLAGIDRVVVWRHR